MRDDNRFKTGREGRRLETRKQQREAGTAYHPRGLARKIVQSTMRREGAIGLNKTDPNHGITQSQFATSWRDRADILFGK